MYANGIASYHLVYARVFGTTSAKTKVYKIVVEINESGISTSPHINRIHVIVYVVLQYVRVVLCRHIPSDKQNKQNR
jgi:hypothetical protein